MWVVGRRRAAPPEAASERGRGGGGHDAPPTDSRTQGVKMTQVGHASLSGVRTALQSFAPSGVTSRSGGNY